MSRNPETCPHSITDIEDNEWFCNDCGQVLGTQQAYYDKYGEPDF